MPVVTQIICLLISFLYGFLCYYLYTFFNKLVKKKRNFYKMFYLFLLITFLSVIYFIIMMLINYGDLHIYFVFMLILGFWVAFKIKELIKVSNLWKIIAYFFYIIDIYCKKCIIYYIKVGDDSGSAFKKAKN